MYAREEVEPVSLNARPPSLSDFGLTDSAVRAAAAREREVSSRTAQAYGVLIVAAAIVGVLQWLQDQGWKPFWQDFVTDPIGFLLVSPFVLFFALVTLLSAAFFAFLGLLSVTAVAVRVASVVDPRLQALAKYREALERFEQWKKRAAIDYWRSLRGTAFEHELARVFRGLGYQAHVTPASGDHGIDIVLGFRGEQIIVQCKAYKQPVGPAAARELLGALKASGATRAILASPSGFTTGVREFTSNQPIQLLDLQGILTMVDQAASQMMGHKAPQSAHNIGAAAPETRSNSEADETFVPPELMKSGWTPQFPKSIANWSAERDVFTWLGPKRSIEDVTRWYESCVAREKAEKNLTIRKRLIGILNGLFGGKCHHGKNYMVESCNDCLGWDAECLIYLKSLREQIRRDRPRQAS